MLANRSIPNCTVIPQLVYPDVGAAVKWLCDAFGFTLRVGIGNHRAQINVGDGAIVVMEPPAGEGGKSSGSAESGTPFRPGFGHSVMVRVADVHSHHEYAKQHGARIVRTPADYPYGERQYTVEDFAGHRWTFTQSIADVAPEEWGGTAGRL
jgi:uncharacterized glyoxalase superfamily protein PhnB